MSDEPEPTGGGYDQRIADAPLLRCTVCGCAYHVQAPRPVPLPFVCLPCRALAAEVRA